MSELCPNGGRGRTNLEFKSNFGRVLLIAHCILDFAQVGDDRSRHMMVLFRVSAFPPPVSGVPISE